MLSYNPDYCFLSLKEDMFFLFLKEKVLIKNAKTLSVKLHTLQYNI